MLMAKRYVLLHEPEWKDVREGDQVVYANMTDNNLTTPHFVTGTALRGRNNKNFLYLNHAGIPYISPQHQIISIIRNQEDTL